MVTEMGNKLRGLGVPFFGTKAELIRYEDASVEGAEKREEGEGGITEKRLLEMQRKILGILEDLCAT